MNEKIVNDRKPRYSIRKYAMGVCSVLLGFWMVSLSQTVSADDNTGNSDFINNAEVVLVENDTTVLKDGEVNNDIEELIEVEENIQGNNSIDDIESLIDSYSSTSSNIVNDNGVVDNSIDDSLNSEVVKSSEEDEADFIENNDEAPTSNEADNLSDIELSVEEEVATDEPDIEIPTTPKRAKALSATSTGVIGDDYPYSTVWEIDQWGLYTGECTSFVAWRLSSVNGFEIPRAFGNASEWGTNASALGYAVNMTPAVGSVAWISSGHVAWVASVSGDNVVIEEYNWNGDHAYHTGTYAKTHYSGFIHFKDISSGSQSGGSTTIPSSGTYTFTSTVDVKDAPKVSANTVATYSAGQSVNYDSTVENDGYQWISYISYSGARRYVAVSAIEATVVKGTISIVDVNSNSFGVRISNVSSNKTITKVLVPTWTSENDQDDIVWYTATKVNDTTYTVTVPISEHGNSRGEYVVHLYYVLSDGKTVGVAGSTYSEIWKDVNIGSPSGTITIQNNNSTTGTFDVIISNVYNPDGVKGVKVPIWSTQNGQDDIIWYDATLQSNGTYKVSVSASNHQNNTGEYNVHLYYVQNDGSLRGIAVTTVTVQKKTSSIKATVNGSTYTFTDTVEVRNEANTSSAVVFYFNKGDSVNNASLITSNGHQWVTYTSYSGVKRYVLVD